MTTAHVLKDEFYDQTPGKMASEFARMWPKLSGYIRIMNLSGRSRGRTAPRVTTFIFHDGVAKIKRNSHNKVGLQTTNGMCFNCGFLSCEQDLYLVMGKHPGGGEILHEGVTSTVRSEYGYGHACARCMRDNGWRPVTSEDKVFRGDHVGYRNGDETKWYSIEPLPEKFRLGDNAPYGVEIDAIRKTTTIEGE